MTKCSHKKIVNPDFNEKVAIHMTASEIRKEFPRKVEQCPDCKETVILYASFKHYIYGDY